MEGAAAEILVDATAWLALFLYPFGLAAGGGRIDSAHRRRARWLFTVGAAIFMLHVLLAFAVHYDLSHAVALAETARQTEQMTGVASGWGLWLNYLFVLLWLSELAWWWSAQPSYVERPASVTALVHGFFLFLIVNGTVVFVQWPRRGLGLVLLALCALALWWRRRGASPGETAPGGLG